ncbi:MAG: GNAT family N-acetyltransferase, partial [Anaerolineae bacterium]|nr:GNAT family N-acetyltransferase [Anaerolineae bacterium]
RCVAFVDSVPNANIFHHPAWTSLMAECYGYRPFVVATCDEKGEIKAGLPLMEVNSWLTGRRWISLPFTDHCNPLYRGDTPPRELFEYLSELQREHDVPRVEIRSAVPRGHQAHEVHSQVLHVQVLSPDTRAVHGKLHENVRRCIVKAERQGVTVRWAESKRDLDVFYDLHCGTRHRQGVPVQPKRYFELFWERIIGAGLGFILLAYKDAVPIAGTVALTYKSTLMIKYTASDRDSWRLSPNHSLYWAVIRWGCEHGYTSLDWGRTRASNTGLRDFKRRWGAQESILTYSILSAAPPGDVTNRLSGIMGATIRHTPSWVCRVTGELLYRHFA